MFSKFVKHSVAKQIKLGFQSVRFCVKSGVNYARVCFGRTETDVAASLQQRDIDLITTKFSGNSASYYAAADNDNVFHTPSFNKSYSTYNAKAPLNI